MADSLYASPQHNQQAKKKIHTSIAFLNKLFQCLLLIAWSFLVKQANKELAFVYIIINSLWGTVSQWVDYLKIKFNLISFLSQTNLIVELKWTGKWKKSGSHTWEKEFLGVVFLLGAYLRVLAVILHIMWMSMDHFISVGLDKETHTPGEGRLVGIVSPRGFETKASPRIEIKWWAMSFCWSMLQWFSRDRITG